MKSERNTQFSSCTEPMMKLVLAKPAHSRTPACTSCAAAGLGAAARAASVHATKVEDRIMLLPLTGFQPHHTGRACAETVPADQVRFPQKRWMRRQASSRS